MNEYQKSKQTMFCDKYGTQYHCDFKFDNCDTLILSGGALKCIYFLGSLCALDKNTINNFRYFGGTSCGAMLSSLLAVGYTPFEIFKRIYREKVAITELTRVLDKVLSIMETMFEEKGVSKNITFAQVYAKFGKKLAFIAGNASKMREEIFCIETYPKLEVLMAVKLSCSLPIIFPLTRFNDNIFIDGIFFDNFPIKITKLFTNHRDVLCITTSSSHYDKGVKTYYSDSSYKMIFIPDSYSRYFLLSQKDKFYMFVTGFNYISDHIKLPKKERMNARVSKLRKSKSETNIKSIKGSEYKI